jgi:CheY-like chemotaxis protein
VKNLTVLAVDDDPWDLEAVRDALVPAGYEVKTANDGATALQIFRQRASFIDLVISDIKMAPMSGWELGAQLVTLAPDLPIIFASGYAAPEIFLRQESSILRCSFLRKPFTPKELHLKIEEILPTLRRPEPPVRLFGFEKKIF